MKNLPDFWTVPWEEGPIIFMSSMKGSKAAFCVQLCIMSCYCLVLNRCLITAAILIYGTGIINKPRYAAIKEIKNWHRKHFKYFRRNLLYIDISMPKISVKKSIKIQEGLSPPTCMVGGFISFSQHLCITSNTLKSFYFSFCRWAREIKKVTFMSQQVTAKMQLEMRINYSFCSHSKTLLPAMVIALNLKGICCPALIFAYFI